MTTDEGMKFAFVIAATEESPYWDSMTEESAEATWDEWIARARREAKAEVLREIAPHLNDIGDEDYLLRIADQYEEVE